MIQIPVPCSAWWEWDLIIPAQPTQLCNESDGISVYDGCKLTQEISVSKTSNFLLNIDVEWESARQTGVCSYLICLHKVLSFGLMTKSCLLKMVFCRLKVSYWNDFVSALPFTCLVFLFILLSSSEGSLMPSTGLWTRPVLSTSLIRHHTHTLTTPIFW